MEAALYDERDGYYSRARVERWGRAGDYRTSPERSPLFAATFARFFSALYEKSGSPETWTIWESGAGAGYFAHRVLQTLARSFPQVFSATRYVIDEISASSRSLADGRLCSFGSRVEHRRLTDDASRFESGVLFANELLDAFPVHRVRVRQRRLFELFVGLSESRDFVWVEREPATPLLAEYFERLDIKLSEGQVAEVNLRAVDYLERASKLFHSGYLIIVDYGAEAEDLYDMKLRPHGTLRAFRRHSFVDNPLGNPGEQDLTTTVNWTSVRRACQAAGFEMVSFERQDRFLLRAGLLDELSRMEVEVQGVTAASLRLSTTAREMILPGGMSSSFQVLVMKK